MGQQRQVQRHPLRHTTPHLCITPSLCCRSACTAQVAYLAKRNSDMLADQMTALPCASTFPGSPAAGAVPMASATVTVSAPHSSSSMRTAQLPQAHAVRHTVCTAADPLTCMSCLHKLTHTPLSCQQNVQPQVNATYAGSYTGPYPPRNGAKWLSTGLWAPAGSAVIITIPAAVAATVSGSGVLGIQIGSHSDDISKKATWCRLPYSMLQRRWFTNAAGGNSVTVTAGMGGLLYIYSKWVSAAAAYYAGVLHTGAHSWLEG